MTEIQLVRCLVRNDGWYKRVGEVSRALSIEENTKNAGTWRIHDIHLTAIKSMVTLIGFFTIQNNKTILRSELEAADLPRTLRRSTPLLSDPSKCCTIAAAVLFDP